MFGKVRTPNESQPIMNRTALYRWLFCFVVLFLTALPAWAQNDSSAHEMIFDLERLSQAPEYVNAEDIPSNGLNAIFYEGVPYQGNPTKVFAYYGLPDANSPTLRNGKVPGVVLIHGGGGTAFAEWVKLWNQRGFAAIAMDVCGCVPVRIDGRWQRHPEGGPPGWDASFDQIDGPVEDQWQTHAVSAAMLAHSLLRSLPEVDSDRIGVTGISWGGYLTCIVAGIDDRFRCAVPVYGCGYLGDNSVWVPRLDSMGKARADKWLGRWDPSVFLSRTQTPMLWVNGTNDFAYPMDSWQRSAQLHEPSLLCLRIRMPHGHGGAGENPEEIHAFMNSILCEGKPLPEFIEVQSDDLQASARFRSEVNIAKAELCYTIDEGAWQERNWQSLPMVIEGDTVSAQIPPNTKVWYINLFDERDCVISTRYFVTEPR